MLLIRPFLDGFMEARRQIERRITQSSSFWKSMKINFTIFSRTFIILFVNLGCWLERRENHLWGYIRAGKLMYFYCYKFLSSFFFSLRSGCKIKEIWREVSFDHREGCKHFLLLFVIRYRNHLFWLLVWIWCWKTFQCFERHAWSCIVSTTTFRWCKMTA